MTDKKDNMAVVLFVCALIISTVIFFSAILIRSSYVVNDELVIINYAHEKIHEGEHYFIRNTTTLGNEENYTLLFWSYDKEVHLTIEVDNSVQTHYSLYENVSVTVNGTPLYYYNRNRYYGDQNSLQLYTDPLWSGDKIIAESRFEEAKKFGGLARDSNEIILRNNTMYILFIQNEATGDDTINYVLDWYEQ